MFTGVPLIVGKGGKGVQHGELGQPSKVAPESEKVPLTDSGTAVAVAAAGVYSTC